jgi:hypothetical protein
MPPLPEPGCVLSKFGCCPDGITPAGGYNFRGCPEEAPVILGLSQEEVAIIADENIVLHCRVKGAPLPQITWYRENEPLAKFKEEEDRLVEHPDGSLQITRAARQDSVRYTCRAFNGVGEPATKTFILHVHEPVYFGENLTSAVTVVQGGTAILPCGAHGVPSPRIEWLRDDSPVQFDGLRVTLGDDDSLNIDDVTDGDAGEYVCQASNGVKDPKRRSVRLHVQGPLAVEMGEHAGMYEVGDDARLMCHVFGGGDITVTWSKNNEPLKPNKRFMETAQGELLIEGIIRHDQGNYTCTVTRGQDQASVTTQIKVEGVEIPEECIDMPRFANCRLIVKGRFCRHEYFSRFCCRSCHEAGLLP